MGTEHSMEQHKTTLRDLREQNGMTRAEVAKALGVSYQAISNYEAGRRSISVEQIIPLAELYDCNVEEIIMAQLESVRIGKSEQIVSGNFKEFA